MTLKTWANRHLVAYDPHPDPAFAPRVTDDAPEDFASDSRAEDSTPKAAQR